MKHSAISQLSSAQLKPDSVWTPRFRPIGRGVVHAISIALFSTLIAACGGGGGGGSSGAGMDSVGDNFGAGPNSIDDAIPAVGAMSAQDVGNRATGEAGGNVPGSGSVTQTSLGSADDGEAGIFSVDVERDENGVVTYELEYDPAGGGTDNGGKEFAITVNAPGSFAEIEEDLDDGTLWVDVYTDIEAPTVTETRVTTQTGGGQPQTVAASDRVALGGVVAGNINLVGINPATVNGGRGSLNGVAGTFSCLSGCLLRADSNGVVSQVTGWTFTPDGEARTVVETEREVDEDNDWLAAGLWLYVPDSVSVFADIEFGAFAEGGDPYESGIRALTGRAEYLGGATGISFERGDDGEVTGGYFGAEVQLIADFDDDQIFGRIYGFGDGEETYDGELILDRADIARTGFFTGETSAVEGGWSGNWGGQFYGTEHSNADDHPGSVAGTFGASRTEGGNIQESILGVFGAYYGDDYEGDNNPSGYPGARHWGGFEEIYDPLIETVGSGGLQIGQSTVEDGTTAGMTGEVPTVTPDFHDGELHLALEHTGSEVPFSVDSNTDDETYRGDFSDSTYIDVEGRDNADNGRVVTYMLTSLRDADTPSSSGNQQVPANTDWLAGGVWFYIPDDSFGDPGEYEFGAFGRGTDPFTQSNVAGLMGQANYVGRAIGLIGNSRGFPYYEAEVALTAQFGTNSQLGTISGTVSNFDDESGLTGQLTLGSAGIGDSSGGRFSGALSGNIDGADYTGTWGGAFFGNTAGDATAHPEAAAGTFGGDDGDGSSIVGVFSAELQ